MRPEEEKHGGTRKGPRAKETFAKVLREVDGCGQARLNGCLNAIEAMPQGGDLFINVYLGKKKSLCLEVKDTGTGIEEKDLAHIFDPYFTTKGHGTGLGLATVHKMVDAHGAELQVTSRHESAGQPSGTVFRIILPVAGG